MSLADDFAYMGPSAQSACQPRGCHSRFDCPGSVCIRTVVAGVVMDEPTAIITEDDDFRRCLEGYAIGRFGHEGSNGAAL
jgi:hypothetical protein